MKTSKVKIFTEGGSGIGLGHISRCSSLYDEVASRGIVVEFIIHGNIECLDFLKGRTVKNVNWLSEDYLNNDINNTDYCIVDSYLASKDFYQIISNKSKKALFIDDNVRIKYPKGIIVNPSLSVDDLNYPLDDENIFLLGSKYIILRRPFINVERNGVNKDVKKILVTMGGSDLRDLTPKIINGICRKYPEIKFHVVIGNTFHNIKDIESIELSNVELHYNIDAELMKSLMLKSDFAITAAGQTIYELLATQTPFITIKIAENQNNNIASLEKLGLIIRAINYNDKALSEKIFEDFKWLFNHMNSFKLANKCGAIIDGLGSRRIINALLEGDKMHIEYRSVNKDDCELLYKWANDSTVKENAFSPELIEYDTHRKWFEVKLSDENSRIYIAHIQSKPIGQIRIDIKNEIGLIDYSIDKKCRGFGYGTLILTEIINLIKNDKTVNINKLIGRVKYINVPSQRVFIKAGYRETIFEDYKEYSKEIK